MTNILSTIRALFVEDRYATRLAYEQYMSEFPFVCDFAEDFDDFKTKFEIFKPNAIVVDYDLKAGKFQKEIFEITKKTSDIEKRYIGMIGVTALTPYDYIKKQFTNVGYHKVFFDDGSREFFLNIIGEFNKISNRINEEKRKKI